MITKAFSVYDVKAEMFNTPFFFAKEGMALRAFANLVNDPKSMIFANPSDYILFLVGEFNDDNGLFTCCTPVKQLAVGSALVDIDKKSVPVPFKPEEVS